MRTPKHFPWGHKKSLFFVGIQEVSVRRVRKELIIIICICLREHSELTRVGSLKMMENSRNTYIHIQQNIFALKALYYIQQLYIYAASRNCIYSTSRKLYIS